MNQKETLQDSITVIPQSISHTVKSTTYKKKHKKYYQRHRYTILQKKKTQYHIDKLSSKPLKLDRITKSPSPIISNNIALSKLAKSPILTMTDVLNYALKLSNSAIEPKLVLCHYGKLLNGNNKIRKVRINPLLSEVVRYILSSHWRNIYELRQQFSDIKPRTLRAYLKELQKLKWIRRHGIGYHINPFLLKLIEKEPQFMLLSEFAPLKLDVFDIMNLPLISILDQKVRDVQIDYYDVKDRYFNEIFKGVTLIEVELENREKTLIFLPVNLHGQSIYGKKRYLEHYCIPLKWRLFDIQKASYYSTNNKRNHHKSAINKKNESIHFDNSISLLFQPKGRFYMLWEKKFFEQKKTSIKYWQGYEYLEVNDIEVLKRLFTERFVNNKRRLELFDSLNMTYKQLH